MPSEIWGGVAVVGRCELLLITSTGVPGTGINSQLGDLEAFSATGRVFVVPTRQTIWLDAAMNGACDGCTTTTVVLSPPNRGWASHAAAFNWLVQVLFVCFRRLRFLLPCLRLTWCTHYSLCGLPCSRWCY